MVKQVDILAFGKMKSRIMAEKAILMRRLLAFDNFFMVFKDSEKKMLFSKNVDCTYE